MCICTCTLSSHWKLMAMEFDMPSTVREKPSPPDSKLLLLLDSSSSSLSST